MRFMICFLMLKLLHLVSYLFEETCDSESDSPEVIQAPHVLIGRPADTLLSSTLLPLKRTTSIYGGFVFRRELFPEAVILSLHTGSAVWRKSIERCHANGVKQSIQNYTLYMSGFNIPRGPGAYAPRFCCGPLDFSE